MLPETKRKMLPVISCQSPVVKCRLMSAQPVCCRTADYRHTKAGPVLQFRFLVVKYKVPLVIFNFPNKDRQKTGSLKIRRRFFVCSKHNHLIRTHIILILIYDAA